MDYIPSDEIINRVKNSLGSYFAANKLDESIFPPVIRRCLGHMGLKILPPKRAVVPVVDYRGKLPSDFKKLTLALWCGSSTTVYEKNGLKWRAHQKVVKVHTEIQPHHNGVVTTCHPVCCEAFVDSCGNVTKIVQETEYDAFEYSSFVPMKPSKATAPLCDKSCFNLSLPAQTPYSIEVKQVRPTSLTFGSHYEAVTTEQEGVIYIEYLADVESDEGFEIPDNPTVTEWIYQELLVESFTYLYNNGEDVLQRKRDAERLLAVWEQRAQQVYKRSEISDYYDTAKHLASRYGQMQRQISGGVYRPAYHFNYPVFA